jgi:hypothetical protein
MVSVPSKRFRDRSTAAASAFVLAAAGAWSCGSKVESAQDHGPPNPTDAGADAAGRGGVGGSGGSGGSSGANGGTVGSDVVGDAIADVQRPPAPPWKPPFDLADPGWRQSTKPLCTERFGTTWARVWSDDAAVFALVSAGCNTLAGVPCGGHGTTLYQNGGSGWMPLKTWTSPAGATGGGPTGLAGFVDGPLVIYPDDRCISFVDRTGKVECAWENTAGTFISDVLTVGSSAAYAIVGKQVFAYSNAWNPIGTLAAQAPEAVALGATADTVVVAGYSQLALRRGQSGDFEPLPAAPAGNYTSAWVFGRDDIWFGNSFGQLVHFNGTTWQIIETGVEQIDGLWGSPEGTLFFYTPRAFGRWNAQGVQLFAEATLEQSSLFQFTDLWGNSSNEVFLGVIQRDLRDYECSGVFTVWFDGSKFHLF